MVERQPEVRTNLTTVQALLMLAQTEMRPFTKLDWDCFLGCESKEPMIGDGKLDGNEYVIVLDGDTLNIIQDEDFFGGQLFKLTER